MLCFSKNMGLPLIRNWAGPASSRSTPKPSKPSYAILTGLTEQTATLRAAGTEQTVTLTALARRWQATSPRCGAPRRLPRGGGRAGRAGGGLGRDAAVRRAAYRLPPATCAWMRGCAPKSAPSRSHRAASRRPPGPLTYMQLNRASGIEAAPAHRTLKSERMSYILDALRKADAERERDPARGIHAQPMTAAGERGPLHMPAWALAAAAGLVALAAGAALWEREPPVVAEAVAPVSGRARANRGARAGARAACADGCHQREPARTPPWRRSARRAERPQERLRPADAQGDCGRDASERLRRRAGCAGCSCARRRTRCRAGRGPHLRARRVARRGAARSPQADHQRWRAFENAAQRMLIVGGQVLGEGAVVAPGVTLEQIRPRAVLRFRGYRYSLGY